MDKMLLSLMVGLLTLQGCAIGTAVVGTAANVAVEVATVPLKAGNVAIGVAAGTAANIAVEVAKAPFKVGGAVIGVAVDED